MNEPSVLLRFARCLRIAHHIPGRVRLKLVVEGDFALDGGIDAAKRFIRSITAIPGIRSVNLNPLARSCVVEYDPALIPPAAWQDVVSGTGSAEAEVLLQAIGRVASG